MFLQTILKTQQGLVCSPHRDQPFPPGAGFLDRGAGEFHSSDALFLDNASACQNDLVAPGQDHSQHSPNAEHHESPQGTSPPTISSVAT